VASGIVIAVGWQNKKNHKVGFGFRVRVSIAGGFTDIYAHLDPASVSVEVGGKVTAGQVLGRYAVPANGSASGHHLHFQRDDRNGNAVELDWGQNSFPVPGGTMTSTFGYRNHPVTGGRKLHEGYDFI
jgi:murein DD-endopeptidase MepM/ murein hydrolase activator NlpD